MLCKVIFTLLVCQKSIKSAINIRKSSLNSVPTFSSSSAVSINSNYRVKSSNILAFYVTCGMTSILPYQIMQISEALETFNKWVLYWLTFLNIIIYRLMVKYNKHFKGALTGRYTYKMIRLSCKVSSFYSEYLLIFLDAVVKLFV